MISFSIARAICGWNDVLAPVSHLLTTPPHTPCETEPNNYVAMQLPFPMPRPHRMSMLFVLRSLGPTAGRARAGDVCVE